MNLTELKNKLHKYERGSAFVHDLFNAIFIVLSSVDELIATIKKEFFFDTITIGIKAYEKLLAIKPYENATIDERRSAIRAKWLSHGKNTMQLIQDVCNSWQNGEVKANFVNAKIHLQFIGSYGIPKRLDDLLSAVDEIKPAHINYEILFKYLLIKNIHNVKTIREMNNIKIGSFASGIEG